MQSVNDVRCLRLARGARMCVKFIGCVFLAMVSAYGCSSAKVHVSAREVLPTPVAPQIQTDSQADRQYPGGGEAIIGNLAEWLAQEWQAKERSLGMAVLMSADEPEIEKALPQIDHSHEAELVGNVWITLPEPGLIEAAQSQVRCAESAAAWCEPGFEAAYLAYLEQEKMPKFGSSIFPEFVSPVDEGLILRGMQASRKGKRGHYGVDIIPASRERAGTSIKAVEDGVVVKTGAVRGYGYCAIVYHQDGLFSLYSHLTKKVQVEVGQMVQRGETIGKMGRSGNARGYHLHFELIDLQETWASEQDLDEFIEELCANEANKLEFNQLSKLLFSKRSKKDPLPSLPELAMAKRANGKWATSLKNQAKLPLNAAKRQK